MGLLGDCFFFSPIQSCYFISSANLKSDGRCWRNLGQRSSLILRRKMNSLLGAYSVPLSNIPASSSYQETMHDDTACVGYILLTAAVSVSC